MHKNNIVESDVKNETLATKELPNFSSFLFDSTIVHHIVAADKDSSMPPEINYSHV